MVSKIAWFLIGLGIGPIAYWMILDLQGYVHDYGRIVCVW